MGVWSCEKNFGVSARQWCIKLVEYCLYHELVINMSGPFCHAMDTMNGISISPPHRPSFAGLRICNEPIASDAVVESEVSPAITTSDGPAPVGEIEGPLADDFGRVSIAYSEDPSGHRAHSSHGTRRRGCVSPSVCARRVAAMAHRRAAEI